MTTEPAGNRTITKADLVEYVYEKLGVSRRGSVDLVETLFNTLKDQLSDGTSVKLSGFGNFVVRDKKSRVGRNPQTGEAMEIEARRVLTFRPSQILKAVLNGQAALPGGELGSDDDDDDDADSEADE